MGRLFTHIEFSSADVSSPTPWRFSTLCHLHQLFASVRRLCTIIPVSRSSPVRLRSRIGEVWSGSCERRNPSPAGRPAAS